MEIASILRIAAIGLAILTFGTTPDAIAAPRDYERAVVQVIATGTSPALGNEEVQVVGTGFFIHSDGYLLTAAHLRTLLGPVEPSSIQYRIKFNPLSSESREAISIAENNQFDYMVLKVSVVSSDNIRTLRHANRSLAQVRSKTLQTGGYPRDLIYSYFEGAITSDGTVSPSAFWVTNFPFKNGQSGSPITIETDEVIALVKGSDRAQPDFGFVLPIYLVQEKFWEDTLPPEPTPTIPSPYSALTPGEGSARIVIEKPTVGTERWHVETRTVMASTCAGIIDRQLVSPTSGWEINTNTITVNVVSALPQNLGRGDFIVSEANSKGFKLESSFAPEVACGAVPPALVGVEIQILFREKSVTPSLQSFSSTSVSSKSAVPLPRSTKDLRYSIVKADGERVPFTPEPGEILRRADGASALDISKIRSRMGQFE